MPEIRKLDPTLASKIAAGEVIERPASVVKELIENALDAGAHRIDIALEEGGTRLIRVTDDGGGIARDDLALAVEPHATSKIRTADDLFRIRTLGFRGEALASIAAVSHLLIRSRTADQTEAAEIAATEGHVDPIKPAAGPIGTTVEVRNLFYNIPARRKFLRQPSTELANATEQLVRAALAHPETAFSLTHNGRESRMLPATPDRRTRIADFYGPELADCLLPIDRDERGTRIEALVAPPAQSRASSKWQYVFLNGRYISDRRIVFAVREAFRGLVEHDRYPVVFIFLTADPEMFDVNVHPTKIEVRWRDAGLVQSQVLAALRETLLSHDLTPAFRIPAAAPLGDATASEHQLRAREALADYLKSIDPTQARIQFRPPRFASDAVRPSIGATFAPPRSDFSPGEPQAPSSPTHDRADMPTASAPQAAEAVPPRAAESASFIPNEVLQVHNTYLVAQTDEGLVIIDQHALHERILYEKFRQRILAGPLESQRLLIPQTVNVSAAQGQAAEQLAELLRALGIELSAFGPDVLAVQSFPALLPDVDVPAFVGDLLDKLADPGREKAAAGGGPVDSRETLLHAALDLMACKAAVKAGDALTLEEMQALIAQRHLTERSSNCPHGRPTTLQLTTRDLEKQFKRI